MDAFEQALIAMLVCACLFVLFAIPLIMRKVPRNRMYGFRTRATLERDDVWLEVNAHFGRRLLAGSLFSALAILVLYHTALSPQFFVYSSLCVLVAPALIAALDTWLLVRSFRPKGSVSRTAQLDEPRRTAGPGPRPRRARRS